MGSDLISSDFYTKTENLRCDPSWLTDTTDASGLVSFRLPEQSYQFRADRMGSQSEAGCQTLLRGKQKLINFAMVQQEYYLVISVFQELFFIFRFSHADFDRRELILAWMSCF